MSLIDTINSFDSRFKLRIEMPSGGDLERVYQKLLGIADGLDQITNELDHNLIADALNTLRAGETPKLKTMKLICMGGLEFIAELDDGRSLVERIINAVDIGKDALIKAVFIGFLRLADKDNWLTFYLHNFLQKRILRLPKQWKNRCDDYGLLEKPFGAKLAQEILFSEEKSPHELMAAAGLRGVLAAGGFSKTVFIKVCEKLANRHNEKLISRFWDYIGNNPHLFANDIKSYTQALLSPYRTEEPVESIRLEIERFIIGNFGDPRLKQGSYSPVSEELLAVLYRWLTHQTFAMLMEVVKRSNNTNHWKERSEFWQFYIDNDYISEAWVAFGTAAYSEARALVRSGELKSHGAFGRLEKGSIQPMHSVIFMKIGDMIFSEWTHDGKVRCYLKGNEHKPKLYHSKYDGNDIRRDALADLAQVHYSKWQLQIKTYIHKHTGIENDNQSSNLSSNRARRSTMRTSAFVETNKSRVTSCLSCGKVTRQVGLDSNGRCYQCRGLGVKNR